MENQRQLYAWIRQGKSFSGHEANCCFLNMGNGRFADVAHLSGFDWKDDGRAVALVDWDRDGDLDVWTSNRSGPRLRFLEHTGSAGNWLQVYLIGSDVNRDAIGARAVLEYEGLPQTRSVSAGSGYLAQSSRWLHFGLGESDAVPPLRVRWPDGTVEVHRHLQANRRYLLRQGEAPELDHRSTIELAELSETSVVPPDRPYLKLIEPLPLPPLPVEDREGRPLLPENDQYRVLNLWSATCAPCLEELQQWSDERLDAPLEIWGVHVDVADDEPASRRTAEAAWKRVGAPGALAFSSTTLLDILQATSDVLLAKERSLALPTTFLITPRGELMALYRGPVTLEQVRRDLREPGRHDDGRWLSRPNLDPLFLASRLIERTDVEVALRYLDRCRREINPSPRLAAVQAQLGARFLELNRRDEAERAFRDAVAVDPGQVDAWNDLGGLLKLRNDLPGAIHCFEQARTLDPDNAVVRANLGATLLAQGQLQPGLAELTAAVNLDPDHVVAHQVLAETYRRLQGPEQALAHYEAAARAAPDQASIWVNWGTALLSSRSVPAAIEVLESAVKLDPDHPAVHKNLGLAYALVNEPEKACAALRVSAERRPDDASVHYNLGILLYQQGDIDAGLKSLETAVRLQPANAGYQRALREMQKR